VAANVFKAYGGRQWLKTIDDFVLGGKGFAPTRGKTKKRIIILRFKQL